MVLKSLLAICLVCGAGFALADQQQQAQRAVVLDENLWVTFYDLPSRRFRAIRNAVLSRDKAAASADLQVTANYLSVEADRAIEVIARPLQEVVTALQSMSEDVNAVTLQQLDVLFGRTHWLLSQHYLALAKQARDARQDRNTSLYLWAAVHHMERALLWSNVTVNRRVQDTFEDLRKIASELRDPETAARAYKERPVVKAEQLLRRIGEQMDRQVLLPAMSTPAE